MRQCFAVFLVIVFVSVSLVSLVTVVQGQAPTEVTGEEFTRPMLKETGEEWPTFSGVGHSLRYPPTWQTQPYQAQGSLRNSALFQFVWTDSQGLAAQVEALEIVTVTDGAAALETELAYWQQTASRDYDVEAVTVQGHPGWWIHAAQPLDTVGLAGVLWANWGERVYRFRLTCRPDTCVESEQQLRQMLSTLQVVTIDWQRAPEPPLSSSSQTAPDKVLIVLHSPTVVTYNRNAAYTYGSTYWNQKANDDGHYLTSGAYDADGAHFVNRAVHAGGRPIPALWDAAAINVIGLRNWLQGDGWTTTPAAQAAVGDVAIMGPFSNPCWVGLVVVTGTNPTLATHSAELWASANSMYCYDSGTPTYVKTYLHANIEVITSHVYLPLVLNNYPAKKEYTGIHLGNRIHNGWTTKMLQPFKGHEGGTYPRIIVVQSDQLWGVYRPTNSPCEVAGAGKRTDQERGQTFDYLTQAAASGTTVIIRIVPSPGNFVESIRPDWDPYDPSNRPPTRTLITQPEMTPGNQDYCNGNIYRFRAVDDLVEEMQAIYDYNTQVAGWPAASFYFVPANEPNLEWYSDKTLPSRKESTAWNDMDDYFAALIAYARQYHPQLRILTPPMSQSQYAEGVDWMNADDPCKAQLVDNNQTGYEIMADTYQRRSNSYHGYSWHNYYIQGRETFQTCYEGGFHVSLHFPDFMLQAILWYRYPSFVTEADLCSSPNQCYGSNPIKNKENDPAATVSSLNYFFQAEYLHTYAPLALWLLNNDDSDKPEFDWHESFNETLNDFYTWFKTWWNQGG